MENFISFFGCGRLEKKKNFAGNSVICFMVTKFSDINEKIIPFFNKYAIVGNKSKHYLDWYKAAKIVQFKDHITKNGLDQITSLKSGMNIGRSS